MKTERGSATIWVLAASALVALVAATATVRAIAVLARHRAEAAADLAALAAASRIGIDDTACAAADRIAAENGVDLVECTLTLDPDGRSGEVSVVVGADVALPPTGSRHLTASARAGRGPASPSPVAQSPPAPGASPGKHPR